MKRFALLAISMFALSGCMSTSGYGNGDGDRWMGRHNWGGGGYGGHVIGRWNADSGWHGYGGRRYRGYRR